LDPLERRQCRHDPVPCENGSVQHVRAALSDRRLPGPLETSHQHQHRHSTSPGHEPGLKTWLETGELLTTPGSLMYG
jgi:hypothetical protein